MPIVLADAFAPSWDLIADIQILLYFPFMQHAYLAGTLIAITAGITGYFMVLRSQSFAGHSLANVGFAGATGAFLCGIPTVVGLFIAGIGAAVGIQTLDQTEQRGKHSDIAVGAILTASLALGYLFLHLATAAYAANVYTILFGNILGISQTDVSIILCSTCILLGIMLIISRPLLFASLDPEVAEAQSIPVRALSLLYLILLALEVAIAVQVVGVLLIFALLVTPAAIAQTLTSLPGRAMLLAIVLAISFTWLGLAVGFFTPYPVGFFITTFAFGTYVLVRGGRWLFNRTRHNDHAVQQLQQKGTSI